MLGQPSVSHAELEAFLSADPGPTTGIDHSDCASGVKVLLRDDSIGEMPPLEAPSANQVLII